MRVVLAVAATLLLLLLDLVWMNANKKAYQGMIRAVQRGAPMAPLDYVAAIGVYVLIFLAFLCIVFPLGEGKSVGEAALFGATFGLVAYGIFNLTNKSIFSTTYPWTVVVMDTLWGAAVFAFSVWVVRTVALKIHP